MVHLLSLSINVPTTHLVHVPESEQLIQLVIADEHYKQELESK